MEWYPHLYIGDKVKDSKKVIQKLNKYPKFLNIYVLTLSKNPHDQIDIYKAGYLSWCYYKKNPPYVIGIASDYEEALSIVEKITAEAFKTTGNCRIKDYLLSKIDD